MNGYIAKVNSALNEYENISREFSEWIAKAGDDLKDIKGLSCEVESEDKLMLRFLGKQVSVECNIVMIPQGENENNPVFRGQISARLVKNKDTYENIISVWFDHLLSIQDSPNKNNGDNLKKDNYLKTFFYKVANRLCSSEFMSPDENINSYDEALKLAVK